MGLANEEAGLGTEPDGMFLSYASLRDGRVGLQRREDSLEVVGSPDMVLEVVSPTSVQKDNVLLRDLYWRAGVREYWLVDPRRTDLTFDILRHRPKGFAAARKVGGWIKSAVFGKSFRLIRGTDESGLETYRSRSGDVRDHLYNQGIARFSSTPIRLVANSIHGR